MTRRKFLQLAGGASVAAMSTSIPIWAAEPQSDPHVVPADKGLSEAWLKSLVLRGEPEVFRGEQLKYIGMPVGGLCAGLLYLGG